MGKAFCEDDKLIAREVVLFDRFAYDFLGDAIGVDVGFDDCMLARFG